MNTRDPLIKLLHKLELLKELPHEDSLAGRPECPIRALARLGLLDEHEAVQQIAVELEVDYCDLEDPQVQSRIETKELAGNLAVPVCWKHKVIPLFKENDVIVVAFANPMDFEARQNIQFAMARPIKVVIAEELKITHLLEQYIPHTDAVKLDSLAEIVAEGSSNSVEVLSGNSAEHEIDIRSAETPPIIKLCNKIMLDAVKAGASDIHIEPTSKGVDVRFRIDGVMQSIFEIPKRLQPYVISRFKLSAEMDIAERRRPQDGRLRIRALDDLIDMRVSSVPTSAGEKIVLRVLRAGDKALSFAQLGFPKDIQLALTRSLERSGKMVLVTGPTGSGKTTTLYTCLQLLKDGTRNIETVEDPVEYRIVGINQIQVNEQVSVTFASALRSILRQDPDVIMVGEIRDKETADIALQAAQTGHLVLSTLHTNNAPSAIVRLVNLGVDPHVISSSIMGILAQRLVRAICPDCKEGVDKEYIERYRPLIRRYRIPQKSLMRGKGCPKCNLSGYRERIGIFSWLEVSGSLIELIANKASAAEIAAVAVKKGFVGLDRAGIALVKEGLSTIDEVAPHLTAEDYEAAETKRKARPAAVACVDEQENGSTTVDKGAFAAPSGISEAGRQPDHVHGLPQYHPVYMHPMEPYRAPQTPVDAPVQQLPAVKGFEKPKILLIEDEPDLRALFTVVLQREMFEVIEASNGQEGLEKVYEHQPNLIICDLMMPVMNGKEFIQRLKGHKQTKTIPVIILTNSDTEDNEVDLLELGAIDFVGKGSSHKVMLSRVRKVLSMQE